MRLAAGMLFALLIGGAAWTWTREAESTRATEESGRVDIGPVSVWEHIEGTIESAGSDDVFSTLSQRATIVELAREGDVVEEGNVVARFDSAPIMKSLFGLERDHALAVAALDQLREADIPIELRDLEERVEEPQAERDAEAAYLEELHLLMEEDLVGPAEIDQQKAKIARLDQQVARAENRLKLTQTHIHPSAIARAEAALESARKELEFVQEELAACTVRAPRNGVVIYRPIHIDGEFRTVRVGDAVYRNQTILMVADMDDLLVRCHVPEGKLARVREGNEARVTLLPFPDIVLQGRVERVGSMAHAIAGKPAWQKYVTIDIHLEESHPRIRSGMSAFVHVLSHNDENALRIPRPAVYWRDGRPYARIRNGGAPREIALELGPGNDTHFAVRRGVSAGQYVLYP